MKSTILPRCVKETLLFVLDTNTSKSVNIILTDDTETWLNNGQHKFHYKKDGEKYLRIRQGKCDSSDTGITMHGYYYQHKSVQQFRKSITFLTDISQKQTSKWVEHIVFYFKRLFFTTFPKENTGGTFGVIRMVAKKLVEACYLGKEDGLTKR